MNKISIRILTFIFAYSCFGYSQSTPPPPPAPAPTLTPDQAAAQGTADANALADQSANDLSRGQSTQNTTDVSIYSASVDNMLNSQQAEATSAIISSELSAASTTSMRSCSAGADALSDPDCYMSSALAGMYGLANNSTASFDDAGNVAWSNVCTYSSISCTTLPPNPYASVIPPSPTSIDDVIEDLESRGFSVDLVTGTVRVRGGKVIYTSQVNSLKKALGDESTKKLLEKIKSIERSALKKLSAISRKQALQALGLMPKNGKSTLNPLAGYSSKSDNSYGIATNQNQGYREIANTRDYDDGSEMGMVTSYRGEPVGVSKDSLFRMVKHRYEVKKLEKSFMAP